MLHPVAVIVTAVALLDLVGHWTMVDNVTTINAAVVVNIVSTNIAVLLLLIVPV